MSNEGLLGVILAGGAGARLGGDKPFKKVAGRRLIDLALEILVKVCPKIVISTNDTLAYTEFPYQVIVDRWPGEGPLAALATIFLDTSAEGLLAMGVDMPLVQIDLLKVLAQGHGRNKALCPIGPRYWPEPLLAYYSRACLPNFMQLLIQGERRLRIMFDIINATYLSRQKVIALDPNDLSFININFPEDLERVTKVKTM